MTIKRKLQLNGFITFVFVLAIGVASLVTSKITMKEFEKQKIVEQIVSGVVEQRALNTEYVLFRQDRPIVQWHLKEKALRAFFASPLFQSPDEQKVMAEFRDNLDSRALLLAKLVANHESSKQISDPAELALNQELDVRIRSQLATKSLEAVTTAFQLSDGSRLKTITAQERSGILVTLLVSLLLIIAVVAMFIINKTVIKPLTELRQRAEEVSRLDFSTTTTTTTTGKARDEVGNLARSFQTMVAKLKESYTGLEQKVIERTNVLEVKTTELERMNKLMVGRELKMIELKKELNDLKKTQH